MWTYPCLGLMGGIPPGRAESDHGAAETKKGSVLCSMVAARAHRGHLARFGPFPLLLARTLGTSLCPISPTGCRALLVVWDEAWLGAWSYFVVIQEHSLTCGID